MLFLPGRDSSDPLGVLRVAFSVRTEPKTSDENAKFVNSPWIVYVCFYNVLFAIASLFVWEMSLVHSAVVMSFPRNE